MAPENLLQKISETSPYGDNVEANHTRVQADNKWRNLPSKARHAELAHVEVYLDDFIGVVQGGPKEHKKMTRHLFSSIDYLSRPNNPLNVAREEPILLKTGKRQRSA